MGKLRNACKALPVRGLVIRLRLSEMNLFVGVSKKDTIVDLIPGKSAQNTELDSLDHLFCRIIGYKWRRPMKIVYHPRYTEVYSPDPASSPGRLEAILRELKEKYEFVKPELASEEDLLRVHSKRHLDSIKADLHLYQIAALAAGGAIQASSIAVTGEASFGLIRPPGHHASSDHCWGFCFFNNIAIALAKLKAENKIEKALILDFDLHFGDGTANIFREGNAIYFQPSSIEREGFTSQIEAKLQQEKNYDILAISAGFDRHIEDWGGQLTTDDYHKIGQLAKIAAERNCGGRRFAVLEGGYNHDVLGKSVVAFLEGFE
jgi:acetoin utilization deacetylase AcuC-like enzyme